LVDKLLNEMFMNGKSEKLAAFFLTMYAAVYATVGGSRSFLIVKATFFLCMHGVQLVSYVF